MTPNTNVVKQTLTIIPNFTWLAFCSSVRPVAPVVSTPATVGKTVVAFNIPNASLLFVDLFVVSEEAVVVSTNERIAVFFEKVVLPFDWFIIGRLVDLKVTAVVVELDLFEVVWVCFVEKFIFAKYTILDAIKSNSKHHLLV